MKKILNYNQLNESKLSIYEIIRTNNIDGIKLFIKNGGNINQKNRHHETLLIYSTKYYNINNDVIDLLINSGANVNMQDIDGQTALWIAMARNNTETVKKLITHKKIDLDTIVNGDDTYLIFAINLSRIAYIKLLINNGATVKNEHLSFAISRNMYVINIKKLINCADFSELSKIDGETDENLLFDADVETYLLLVDKGVDYTIKNGRGEYSLETFTEEATKYILSKALKINTKIYIDFYNFYQQKFMAKTFNI